MASPNGILLQYQKDWVNDKSPLKIWLKSRQIGFSFAGTLEATIDCVSRKTLWLFLSAGQRQSLELAQKAKDHIDAIGVIEKGAAGVKLESERWGIIDGVEITQSTITFTNGARMLFLPSKPETVRGYSGNVLADEFAIHQDAKRIYAAVYPSITRGYRIIVGSTPMGESGMFYDLYKTEGYSKHCTTIYDAVKDGLAASVGMEDEAFLKMLRDGVPDDDIWDQEYCCKFVSEATAYVSWEDILRAKSDVSTVELPSKFVPTGRLFLGGDIGRKKDLTVFVLLEQLGDVYWIRSVKRMKAKKFSEQRAYVDSLFATLPIQRLCQDATGLGMQLAEELTTTYGTSRVEGITFTLAVKEDLAVRTRRNFEDATIRIPDDRALRSAIQAIRRIPTAGGHFRFDAERSEAGHADEFWALSLALMAADGKPVTVGFTLPSRPSVGQMLRGV